MKSIVFVLCAMIAFAPLYPTDKGVTDICGTFAEVEKSACLIYDGECYVAFISKPLYLRSDRLALERNIREKLNAKYATKFYVACDTGLYFQILELKEYCITDGEFMKKFTELAHSYKLRGYVEEKK